MSKANGRIAVTAIACVTVGLLFIGAARSENPDLLKDAEARRALAAQQAERDVRDARDEAYQTSRTQPAKALERIRGLLTRVDVDPNFTDAQRDALTALLKKDLISIQKIADDAKNPDVPSGFHPVAHDPRVDDGKGIVKDSGDRIVSAQQFFNEQHELHEKKALAFNSQWLDVEKSSIMPTGDISFPRNWAELSKRRLKNNELTATERAILKALAAPITVDLTEQRFGGVIDWFQKQMGQTIVLDKPALDDLNVNSESTTVTLHLEKVSTRTALKKILADLGLTYVIKEETIFVTTPAKAKDMMTVRTYYMGDLVPHYDISFNNIVGQLQAAQAVAQLVNMITNNIDKDSWEVNGKEGGGTIVFDPVSMSLIVKQSAELHMKMKQGLLP